jgi:hypothetical protein
MDENVFKEGFASYVRKFVEGGSQLNVFKLIETLSQADEDDIRSKSLSLYQTVVAGHADFANSYPLLHKISEMEIVVYRKLSEFAFPYWFSSEWFFTFDDKDRCSAKSPIVCLPPAGIAYVSFWQQISTFITISFICVLLGGFFGIILSPLNRSKMRQFSTGNWVQVLICLLIDVFCVLSLFIPFIGNGIDMIWSPISGILISVILKNPKYGFLVFLKELLPIVDIFPLATFLAFKRNLNL